MDDESNSCKSVTVTARGSDAIDPLVYVASEDATTCKDEFLIIVVMLVIGSDDVPIIDGDVRGSDELSGSDEDGEITVAKININTVTINIG